LMKVLNCSIEAASIRGLRDGVMVTTSTGELTDLRVAR